MTDPGILNGLRVIDCGTYIAGPAAAAILSDFGADVIKIERPPYGDPYRYLPLLPLMPKSRHNYCWILDGRNKKSLAVDLSDARGREALLKLTAAADVFITNYPPPLVEKFRLDYEILRALNSRLIYAHVTGYGESGPDAGQPGYDATAYWARSGLMDLVRNGDAEPSISPAGFGDHPASLALFGAILLALYQRERTGQGSKVSTSLVACGAWANACTIQAALVGAQWPERWTRRGCVSPLVNHYVTRDQRRFLLCCLDQKKDWPNLCQALERPDLIGDPRFSTSQARAANAVELVGIIDCEVARKDMSEWAELFKRHDIIFGMVPFVGEVACDRQLEVNGVLVEVEGSPIASLRTVSSPINVQGVAKTKPRFAPGVGEHTLEILQGMGYTAEAIQDLLDRGVVTAGGGQSP